MRQEAQRGLTQSLTAFFRCPWKLHWVNNEGKEKERGGKKRRGEERKKQKTCHGTEPPPPQSLVRHFGKRPALEFVEGKEGEKKGRKKAEATGNKSE